MASRHAAGRDAYLEDIPGLWEDYRRTLETGRVREPHVVLVGEYGRQRLGPDATLHALKTRIERELAGARITVICPGPNAIRRRYASEPRVTAIGSAHPRALRAIATCHVFIVGGGELRTAAPTLDLTRLPDLGSTVPTLASMAAKVARARVCFYGVTVGRLPSGLARRALSAALHRADVVSVCDEASLRALQQLPLERSILRVLDPAVSLEAASDATSDEALRYWAGSAIAAPYVVLSFAAPATPEKVRAIARCARCLVGEHGCHVVLLASDQDASDPAHDDLDLARRVRAEASLPKDLTVLEATYPPATVLALLARARASVVERSSMAQLARAAGIPTQLVTERAPAAGENAARFLAPSAFASAPDGAWVAALVSSP